MNQNAMKLALVLTAILVAGSAFANADLAEKKRCTSCHAIDAKRIGPSYKDIAAKYTADKDAATRLATKVVKGGGGVWSVNPMPANTQVTEAEAKTLVQWILSLK